MLQLQVKHKSWSLRRQALGAVAIDVESLLELGKDRKGQFLTVAICTDLA